VVCKVFKGERINDHHLTLAEKRVSPRRWLMLLSRLRIENYRGVKLLELALDETTVLVGENNCGKTTVLHALRACLYTLRSTGRASPFEEFDLHFASQSADPTSAPPISHHPDFRRADGR
jgi:predicted ATPase